MGKDRLEEHIKDQVYNHNSMVDTDALWNNIQQKRKPKKPLWIYFTAGSLVLGIVIFALIFGISDSPSSGPAIGLSETVNTSKENTTVHNLSVKNASNHKDEFQLGNTVERKKENSEEDIHDNPHQVKNQTAQKPASTGSQFVEPNSAKSTLQNNQDLKSYNPQNFTVRSFTESLITQKKETIESGINSIIKNSDKSVTQSSTASQLNNVDVFNSRSNLESIGQLSLSDLFYSRSIQPTSMKPLVIDVEKPELVKGHWFAGLGVNFNKGDRTLSAIDTLGEIGDTLLRFRDANEEFMESWGADLRIGYQHKSGLFVNTGLAYQQINDRAILNFNNTQTITTSNDTTQSFIQTITPIQSIRHNKIRMIDIPIAIGYYRSLGKFGLSTELGINVNIRTQARGNIILDKSTFISTDGSQGDIFKTNVSHSYQLSLGIHRAIGDTWNISLHPSFRYYPESFTVETFNVEQRYQFLGARLALTRSF